MISTGHFSGMHLFVHALVHFYRNMPTDLSMVPCCLETGSAYTTLCEKNTGCTNNFKIRFRKSGGLIMFQTTVWNLLNNPQNTGGIPDSPRSKFVRCVLISGAARPPQIKPKSIKDGSAVYVGCACRCWVLMRLFCSVDLFDHLHTLALLRIFFPGYMSILRDSTKCLLIHICWVHDDISKFMQILSWRKSKRKENQEKNIKTLIGLTRVICCVLIHTAFFNS